MRPSTDSNPASGASRLVLGLRRSTVAAYTAVAALARFIPHFAEHSRLWPGSRFTHRDRDEAVERGLSFIARLACEPQTFTEWGHDLLWCFYTISTTAKNGKLREIARRIGIEHAQRWRIQFTEPPANDVESLIRFVYGTDIADKLLGDSDKELKRRIEAAVQHFTAIDFLCFDPRHEPPPKDLPEQCPECDHKSARGATACEKCKAPLCFRSAYDIWLDSLVTTYSGDAYGIQLGASYPEALRWISVMRPYAAPEHSDQEQFDDVSYAITHIIYTLNEYGKYRLSPAWLPQEYRYLRTHISEAERYQDWETLGEFLDTLRAFGLDESDVEIQIGMDYLLSHQNPDGSWGDSDDPDVYNRYHSTWTAIDGLREYAFRGEHLRFPHLLPLIRG